MNIKVKMMLIFSVLIATCIFQSCSSDETEITMVEISPTYAELKVGESIQLETKTTPEAFNQAVKVTWSSDNEEVAVIDENGLLHGLKEGIAKITATIAENNSATIRVIVLPANFIMPDFLKGKWTCSKIEFIEGPTIYNEQQIKTDLLSSDLTEAEKDEFIDIMKDLFTYTFNSDATAVFQVRKEVVGGVEYSQCPAVITEKENAPNNYLITTLPEEAGLVGFPAHYLNQVAIYETPFTTITLPFSSSIYCKYYYEKE